ncbi:MAG: tRNA 2-thiocytidine(32) synthetase TtcA [Oligoflexales bacterium]
MHSLIQASKVSSLSIENNCVIKAQDKIRRKMVQAMSSYTMIEDGDRILVAVSGGKDSSIMAILFEEIRRRAKVSFELAYVLVDQKQPGFNMTAYSRWMLDQGIKVDVIEEDTYSVVKAKTKVGKTYCGLCSRLRRGILYTYAKKHGFTKIALGHHLDDLNETVLMNLFYSGTMAGMPPKLKADDGYNVVIRPLCLVPERDLTSLASLLKIPLIPCNLCGSQTNMKRKMVKKLLAQLSTTNERLPFSLLAAQKNVQPSQLMDKKLFNFEQF